MRASYPLSGRAVHPQIGRRGSCTFVAVRATAAAAAEASIYANGIPPQLVQKFREDGYLALPGFASKQQVAALMQRANELVEQWDPDIEARRFSVFTTKEEQSHAKDTYFLDSASEVNFFFEEKAFDEQGQLQTPKALAVNKIGHAMHDLDPVFSAFTRSQPVAAVLRSLGFQRPLPVQSMYIFKQPSIGGEVSPHQDSSFLYTNPMSCVGLWLALEDANLSNGCLWGLKGIHKQGLSRRFRRLPQGGVGFDGPAPDWSSLMPDFEPIECTAGTLVLLHGENVHYSAENTSPVSRHSWALHVVESAAPYVWAADNWAHRQPEKPWTPLYDESSSSSSNVASR
ncbi:hypothetical protein COO60DRAFT_1706389 [Scenedesmus sp. NREL 46B-D3]|nr:hypothetical protein COO60DRAFT_1706389 [Scenedesmus sp. NREL 46B-D3]